MPDFDPDAFMAKRQPRQPKTETGAQTSGGGGFDPDAFMARRRTPPQPTIAPQPRPVAGPLRAAAPTRLETFGQPQGLPTPTFEQTPEQAERLRRAEEVQAMPLGRRLKYELGTGARRGLLQIVELGQNIADLGTDPVATLRENAEGIGRGVLKLGSAFDPVNAETTYATTSAAQDPGLAQLQARKLARRKAADPATAAALEKVGRMLEERERVSPGFVPSTVRGVTSAAIGSAPQIIAGAAGGGIPAITALTAAQSDFTRPEEAAANLAGVVAPVKVARAAAPLVERVAQAVPSTVGRGAVRAAAPLAIGAGTNVAQAAAMGERDPQKLAEAATVGGLMSVTDAGEAAVARLRATMAAENAVRSEPVQPPQMTRPAAGRKTNVVNLDQARAQAEAAAKQAPSLQERGEMKKRIKQTFGGPETTAGDLPEWARPAPLSGPRTLGEPAIPPSRGPVTARTDPQLSRGMYGAKPKPAPLPGPRGLGGAAIPESGGTMTPQTEPQLAPGMYGAKAKPPAPVPVDRSRALGGPAVPESRGPITPQTDPQLARGMYGTKPRPEPEAPAAEPETPPAPRPPTRREQAETERGSRFETAMQLVDEAEARSAKFAESGQTSQAIAELQRQQGAIRDAIASAPKTPEGLRTRDQLRSRVGQIGNRIGDLRRQAKTQPAAGRVTESPAQVEQPAPLAPEPAVTQRPQGRIVNVSGEDIRLTPEQQARWEAEIDPVKPRSRNQSEELSRLKREIVGRMTPTEQVTAERKAGQFSAGTDAAL